MNLAAPLSLSVRCFATLSEPGLAPRLLHAYLCKHLGSKWSVHFERMCPDEFPSSVLPLHGSIKWLEDVTDSSTAFNWFMQEVGDMEKATKSFVQYDTPTPEATALHRLVDQALELRCQNSNFFSILVDEFTDPANPDLLANPFLSEALLWCRLEGLDDSRARPFALMASDYAISQQDGLDELKSALSSPFTWPERLPRQILEAASPSFRALTQAALSRASRLATDAPLEFPEERVIALCLDWMRQPDDALI